MGGRERNALGSHGLPLRPKGRREDFFLLPFGQRSAREATLSQDLSRPAALLLPRHPWSCLPTATAGSWPGPSLLWTQSQAVTAGCRRKAPPRRPRQNVGPKESSAFMLARKLGRIRAPPKKCVSGTYWDTMLYLETGGGSAGSCHKSCQWQSSWILQSIKDAGLQWELRTKSLVR